MWVFICAVYAANTVVACVAEALAECLLLMRWTAPQRHRNVPTCDSRSTKTSCLLAFAERQLLAKSSRERTPSITTGLHPKADIPVLGVG